MRRWLAVSVLALALAGPAHAQPPGKGQPQPKGGPPAVDTAAEAPPPEKAGPPPKVKGRCALPGGGVRVLTLKQKQCRQQNACTCASACPPCA